MHTMQNISTVLQEIILCPDMEKIKTPLEGSKILCKIHINLRVSFSLRVCNGTFHYRVECGDLLDLLFKMLTV